MGRVLGNLLIYIYVHIYEILYILVEDHIIITLPAAGPYVYKYDQKAHPLYQVSVVHLCNILSNQEIVTH